MVTALYAALLVVCTLGLAVIALHAGVMFADTVRTLTDPRMFRHHMLVTERKRGTRPDAEDVIRTLKLQAATYSVIIMLTVFLTLNLFNHTCQLI